MNKRDKVNEYYFWNEGKLEATYTEDMANRVLKDSANSFGVPYKRGDTGPFQAKGSHGIFEYDFFWTHFTKKERILH